MKYISKIKLNQFTTSELNRRKMNTLKGGCQCVYTTTGCSSCSCDTYATFDTNYENNYDGTSTTYVYTY